MKVITEENCNLQFELSLAQV